MLVPPPSDARFVYSLDLQCDETLNFQAPTASKQASNTGQYDKKEFVGIVIETTLYNSTTATIQYNSFYYYL
jgi:hypothetical protein